MHKTWILSNHLNIILFEFLVLNWNFFLVWLEGIYIFRPFWDSSESLPRSNWRALIELRVEEARQADRVQRRSRAAPNKTEMTLTIIFLHSRQFCIILPISEKNVLFLEMNWWVNNEIFRWCKVVSVPKIHNTYLPILYEVKIDNKYLCTYVISN